MKILIVSPGRLPVPAVRGGAVETLIDLLVEYNEHSGMHELWVVSAWDPESERRAQNYRHARFLYLKQGFLYSKISERHLIPYRMLDHVYSNRALHMLDKTQKNYDIIVIENELVNGSVFMERLPGRYIYHAHNDTLEVQNKRDIAFLRSCDKVLTISDYLGEQLRFRAGLSNIDIVYNGVDTILFDRKKVQDQASEKRKQFGLSSEDFVIAFAGRLVEEKGIGVLAEAIMQIPESYRVVLLIIGSSFFGKNTDTPFIRKLKSLERSGSGRILFTGYVKHTEMPVYYAMADVGCVPSLWDEPFGLTVAEQMAMELPVVTTDAGAIPEIVDSTCGFICQRDDQLNKNIASAITTLSRNRDMCREMGKNGRKIIENRFSCTKYCENWFESVRMGETKE